MTSSEIPQQTSGRIMVVDDNPDNLKLLEGMLRQSGYEVRSFPLGRLALASALQAPPDLILLDVNMPEMNGYEVCQRLKSSDELSGIPVLFISALDQTRDKLEGFRAGARDYISKPFHFDEVNARVETHLRLRRAQVAEQQLLERTLNGAIQALMEVVHSAFPELKARSGAIQSYAHCIADKLSLKEPWLFDLAGMLSLIGCIALPEDVFQRAYRAEALSSHEVEMFRAHPESGARLLAHIPRLEAVAEIIRLQQSPGAGPDHIGERILYCAVELDRLVYSGMTFGQALAQLKKKRDRIEPEILDALKDYVPDAVVFHHEALTIRQLVAGMILEDDVFSEATKMLILKKGAVLSETWIERLQNFAKCQGIKEPLGVQVPGSRQAAVFKGPYRSSSLLAEMGNSKEGVR
jgi:CheY-like chemotaxis protein